MEAAETFHAGLSALLPRATRRFWERSPLLRLADALAEAAQRQLEVLLDADDELRRVWEVVDILLAITRGVLRSGVLFRDDGLDSLDRYDYRRWLRRAARRRDRSTARSSAGCTICSSRTRR